MYDNSCDHISEVDISQKDPIPFMVAERKLVNHYKYLGIVQVINS